MKNRYTVFAGVFLIIIGLAAVISFFILLSGEEKMLKWIPTLLVSVGFIVIGITDLANYKK